MRGRAFKRAGVAALLLLALAALGLAAWEPLVAERHAAPPPRTYDVRIVRDDWGVPHIFGATDPDVAFGIGYAQSEDDFPTLQEVIAMTRGRSGALTGADGAKGDYAGHLLGVRDTVARDYDAQPADVRALLDGYASGLNRYAATHPGEVRLSRLFPVNGRDVAAGFVLRSPFFFGLDSVLGALTEGDPPPPESAGAVDAPDSTPLPPAGARGNENGSNAFVVAPGRSADGYTRLLSNSHQPWRGPVAWYELVVQSGTGWHFAGANFPGTPYPLLGHNEALGWTNTVNRPDLTDVYRLSLDEGGHRYRFDGRWLPLERRRVWLPVRLWGPFVLPVPRTVWRSVHGPVVKNDRGAFAIRYAGADQLRMVEEYYRLNRATNFAEWRRALAMQGVPATNFLYADARGNIAFFYNAMFPRRRPGFDYRRVLPGDTSRDLAAGTVPWARVPRLVNPPSGFLVNANNTPFQAAGRGSELRPADWSPLLGIETDTTNRATRALELMSADPSITRADLLRIKFDATVSRRSWAGRWFASALSPGESRDDGLIAAKRLLSRWDWNFDGRGPADALAALMMSRGNKAHYRRRPLPDPVEALAGSAAYLLRHFGRLDPPLGDVLRLREGGVDLPLDGGPDVLRAAALWDEDPDGRLAVKHGDSFVMLAEWSPAGRVRSWSIQPFGAAVSRPASRHHTDQAPLFAAHRLKPVRFHPRQLAGHVERSYRP